MARLDWTKEKKQRSAITPNRTKWQYQYTTNDHQAASLAVRACSTVLEARIFCREARRRDPMRCLAWIIALIEDGFLGVFDTLLSRCEEARTRAEPFYAGEESVASAMAGTSAAGHIEHDAKVLRWNALMLEQLGQVRE